MASHGEFNSRYKDFFDVWILSSRFPFKGDRISAAIHATFARRRSASFSPWPVALSPGFYADATRTDQWTRYLKRSKLIDVPADFATIGERVINFLGPPVRAVVGASAFEAKWLPGGLWA